MPPASSTVRRAGAAALEKAPTGISGLDEITHGGLPRGRPTLVCGSAGCGKSLLGLEFLVRGATEFGEPGVLMTFEETAEDIAKNVASLGFDIDELIAEGKLMIDYVHIDRAEIEENGEYDLEGLFVRLNYAIGQIGAQRVMLDTIETLFGGLSNQGILRAELRRLFGWLKDKGMTTVITGERGDGTLTRQGLEEYVSDCVILLDHRVVNQISTRRLRVVKYRGSTHGTNEYPFLIDEDGISVLPITSVGLTHQASDERINTGVPRLDAMLGGAGFYRGSSVLVTGTAGTGKSSLAAYFADACCRRGESVVYFAFEESPQQIMRNMRSIGLNLQRWVKKGLLTFFAARPSLFGIETHLARMHKAVRDHAPRAVVVDPITNLMASASYDEVEGMLVRLIDCLKSSVITALFTGLTAGGTALEATNVGVSSIMDTWLLLRDIELGGERNRGIYVLKSRGMAHSNQIREFLITDEGIDLLDVYTGPMGVLTGSARLAREAQDRAEALAESQDMALQRRNLDRRQRALEAQIEALKAGFEAEQEEMQRSISQAELRAQTLEANRLEMSRSRQADRKSVNGKAQGSRTR